MHIFCFHWLKMRPLVFCSIGIGLKFKTVLLQVADEPRTHLYVVLITLFPTSLFLHYIDYLLRLYYYLLGHKVEKIIFIHVPILFTTLPLGLPSLFTLHSYFFLGNHFFICARCSNFHYILEHQPS